MNNLLFAGFDPGPVGGSWVVIREHGTEPPVLVSAGIWNRGHAPRFADCSIWIERIVPQGRSVGQETFDTAVSIGRLLEAAWITHSRPCLVRRRSVVLELLGSSPGSTDGHLKKRLIEIFGVVGTAKNPGPLRDLAPLGSHGVAALAVAYYGFLATKLGRGRQGHDWWKFNYETGRCE